MHRLQAVHTRTKFLYSHTVCTIPPHTNLHPPIVWLCAFFPRASHKHSFLIQADADSETDFGFPAETAYDGIGDANNFLLSVVYVEHTLTRHSLRGSARGYRRAVCPPPFPARPRAFLLSVDRLVFKS